MNRSVLFNTILPATFENGDVFFLYLKRVNFSNFDTNQPTNQQTCLGSIPSASKLPSVPLAWLDFEPEEPGRNCHTTVSAGNVMLDQPISRINMDKRYSIWLCHVCSHCLFTKFFVRKKITVQDNHLEEKSVQKKVVVPLPLEVTNFSLEL